jgi:predicted transcriptional regulator
LYSPKWQKRATQKADQTRRRREVARRERKGETTKEIAKALGIGLTTVRKDLKFNLKKLAEATIEETKAARPAKLEIAQWALDACREAWENSQGVITETRTLKKRGRPKRDAAGNVDPADNEPEETIIQTTQKVSPGDPAHMRNAIKALELQCKLLGLLDSNPQVIELRQQITALTQVNTTVQVTHELSDEQLAAIAARGISIGNSSSGSANGQPPSIASGGSNGTATPPSGQNGSAGVH